jgi:hypothetical protein
MVFRSKQFMYKIYLIYIYVHHTFTYTIYLIYVFTYALGDTNFAEYVAKSFILSRRTYVNKIIFDSFLFSFIYILQEYIEIIRRYLANMNSRGKNL